MYLLALRRFAPACLVVSLLCGAPACDPRGAPEGAREDSALFFGAEFRAVWVQDMGDGTDFDAQESRLRLMGLDQTDPRDEFPIIPEIANYARPLITRRGDRVIFSNRKTAKTYVVNWDGSQRREITNGLGVAVWIDPATAEEWVFVARPGPNTDSFGWPMGSIWRYPIDRPAAGELVWDRTDIDVDNFQVSADGTLACGLFPWPNGGMAELPNGPWLKYDEGCWTSLAPDNSYRSWVFDGAHRDLFLFDPGGTNRRVINLSRLPGLDDCEVRHPRWSNHPRFMTMTAPYCATARDENARAGPGVDVYVGRFDHEFTHIESLLRLTHNRRADFFPDLWVAGAAEDEGSAPAPKPAPSPGFTPHSASLPTADDGVVFVWESRAAHNVVSEGDTYIRTCRVSPRGRAWYGRHFEMVIRGGMFEAQGLDQGMLDSWKESGELSVEALITPLTVDDTFSGAIIAFTDEEGLPYFMLSQEGGRLAFSLRTSEAENAPAATLCRLGDPLAQHIVVSYRHGRLVYYRNGLKEGETSTVGGSFDSWVSQRLVFGTLPSDEAPWHGSLEGIRLFSRSVDAQEAAELARNRLAGLPDRAPVRSWETEARLVQATPIPDRWTIAPYHRAMTVNVYDAPAMEPHVPGRILVAHWAMLDHEPLRGLPADPGAVYRLRLERFEDHPQLESERLITDVPDPTLPLFYDVGHLSR